MAMLRLRWNPDSSCVSDETNMDISSCPSQCTIIIALSVAISYAHIKVLLSIFSVNDNSEDISPGITMCMPGHERML